MKPNASSKSAGLGVRGAFWITAGVLSALLSVAIAAAPASTTPSAQTVEVGPRWSEMSPAQRSLLAPIEREWPRMDTRNKQKWLEVAAKLPTVGPAERERIQARMTEWASLSPQQRSQVRLRYQEARQVAPKSRQDRWAAYQALSPEERQRLAARAPHAASGASGAERGRTRSAAGVVTRKVVAPSVVQAQPGATTSLMSRKTTPPLHLQPGMPRLMASPALVDSVTLLPRKNVATPAVSADAEARPRTD